VLRIEEGGAIAPPSSKFFMVKKSSAKNPDFLAKKLHPKLNSVTLDTETNRSSPSRFGFHLEIYLEEDGSKVNPEGTRLL
jgi:hypothetical protein